MGSTNQSTLCKPGYLYRHWSATGELLYVGISINAVARLSQHRNKVWFPQIAKITVKRFDNYAAAERAELRAICRENPTHNAKRPRTPEDLADALVKLRAAQRRAASRPPKISKVQRMYNVDSAFGTIPSDLTFEEYAKNPKKWRKLADEWFDRRRERADRRA